MDANTNLDTEEALLRQEVRIGLLQAQLRQLRDDKRTAWLPSGVGAFVLGSAICALLVILAIAAKQLAE